MTKVILNYKDITGEGAGGYQKLQYWIRVRDNIHFESSDCFTETQIINIHILTKYFHSAHTDTKIERIIIQCTDVCYIIDYLLCRYQKNAYCFVIRQDTDSQKYLVQDIEDQVISYHHCLDPPYTDGLFTTHKLFPKIPMKLIANSDLTCIRSNKSIYWCAKGQEVNLIVDIDSFINEEQYKALRAPFDYFQMFAGLPPHIMRLILQYILL